jgi:VanZ family protein
MSDPGPGSIEVNDKLVHFVLYAVLGVTLSHARTSGRSADRAEGQGMIAHWIMISVGVAYGASDEWHQSFVPGRDPDVRDLLADSAGVVAGYVAGLWALALVLRRIRPTTETAD